MDNAEPEELTPRQEIESAVWQIVRRAQLRALTGGEVPDSKGTQNGILEAHFEAMQHDVLQIMHCVDRGVSLAMSELQRGLHTRTGIETQVDPEMIDQAFQEARKWG